LDIIPLHYRGGSIVPTQAPALTTTASRANPFGADVALDESGAAEGWAYLDDGVTVSAPYTMLHMAASSTGSCSGTVKISPTIAGYKSSVIFGKFRLMGIDSSCYPSSAPAVSANSHAVTSLQWIGALLTIDLSSLALDIVQPLVVVFAPSS
jgi:alpha-glucosidase